MLKAILFSSINLMYSLFSYCHLLAYSICRFSLNTDYLIALNCQMLSPQITHIHLDKTKLIVAGVQENTASSAGSRQGENLLRIGSLV